MQTAKIEVRAGQHIGKCIKDAKNVAKRGGCIAVFKFNGVTVSVREDTDTSLVIRDYNNAHLMKRKSIGPHYDVEYSEETKKSLDKEKTDREEKSKEAYLKYKEVQRLKKEALENEIEGVEFAVSDPEALKKYEEENKDDYGAATLRYTKLWARLMQARMASGLPLKEVYEKASFDADVEYITGFMHSLSGVILYQCWAHGAELGEMLGIAKKRGEK